MSKAWTRWTEGITPWLIVALVATLPRLLFLDADPPPGLGAAFLTDEGWWSHNARQWALFGEWIMDEQNLPIYSTPAYTFVLGLIYKLLGVGFFQTRLLSALSGAATCLVLYGMLRGKDRRVALLAALLLALSYPMLLHNRIGLTESFKMLFLTLAAAAVLRSIERPRWGIAAGALMVVALLAKSSAIIMPVIVPAFWAAHWYLTRRGHPVPFSWKPVRYVILSGAATTLLIGLTVVVPYWDTLRRHLMSPLRSATGALLTDRIRILGLPLSLALNEFYLATLALLVIVALLAVHRLAATRLRDLDLDEVLCWVWLSGGFIFLGVLTYQPYRRFLLVLPPLAILAARALLGGGLRIPEGALWRARPAVGKLVASVIIGMVVAYYLTVALLPVLSPHARTLTLIPGQTGVSDTGFRTGLWHALFFLVAITAWFVLPRIRAGGWRLPAVLALGLFLVLEPGRFLVEQFPPRFTIRDASRAMAREAEARGLATAAVVGNTADTFALETRLFAFTIRRWRERGSFMNLDGMERYRPAFAVETRRSDVYTLEDVETRRGDWKLLDGFAVWEGRGRAGPTRVGFYRTGVAEPRDFSGYPENRTVMPVD